MGLFKHQGYVSDSSTDDERDEKKGMHPEQVGATKALRKVVKNSGQPGCVSE